MKKLIIGFVIAIPIVIFTGLWIGNKDNSFKTNKVNNPPKNNRTEIKSNSNDEKYINDSTGNTNQQENDTTEDVKNNTSSPDENESNSVNTSQTNNDDIPRNAYGVPIDPARYIDPADPSKGLRPNGEKDPNFKATNSNPTQ